MLSSSASSILAGSWRSYSYLHQVGKDPLKYMTLGQLLQKSAEKYGDRDAFISVEQQKKITYGEALQQSDRLAAGFLNLGLKKGDRVGLWCPNLSEWFTIKYACARAGLILVGLNPNYEAPEIEYSINKVGIKCFICPDQVKKMNFFEKISTLIPDLEKREVGKLNSSRMPSLESVLTISDKTLRGTYNYQEVAECSDQSLIEKIGRNQDGISPDEPYSILFSSGTTGKPKAVITSHFSSVNNALIVGREMELSEKHHKICMMVPFFHAFGMSITSDSAVCYGSTVVLTSSTYSPAANLNAIKQEKCTMIHGTPTMHLDLLEEHRKRKENVSAEIAVSGGAPIAPYLLETMQKEFKLRAMKSIYGLTECTAVVFTSKPGEDSTKALTTVGCLTDHIEAKVVDVEGKIVPFGSPGELYLRGYQNMLRYWEDKEKTEEVLGRDGWFRTGDQFIITEDGYGSIVGRLKDMIIRGGENIYPKEIEEVLITHPKIADVHIIGVPHERLGEEVCACLRLEENSTLTLQELKSFCTGKMANFKIPSHIKIVDSFPKTTSGKVQKFLLKKEF